MRMILALLVLSVFAGCSTTQDVRYVYQDGDYGVIGLPENTDSWPSHYRSRADKLMEKHFPQGHEIIRAEEVVEGERTRKVEGSNSAEVSPEIPKAVLKVGKIGHSESHSESETLKLKECRIVYRRSDLEARPKGYASAAGLNPTEYIDPNAAERKKATADDKSVKEKKVEKPDEG